MKRVPIGCQALDDLLGGGIEDSSVTLIYGEGGCGKTNICLQLAFNVVKSGKKVAFIDAEGISYDRIRQIFGEDDAVKNLLVFQVHSFEEQSDRIDKISRLAEKDVLGMVIIDSMTTFYRLNHDDPKIRNDLIRQTEVLLGIARRYEVPVLISSQVYSNLQTGTIEFLGGHAMQHNAKTIIRLDKRNNGVRTAVVIKHRSLPEGRTANYRITATGISDV
ncbi:MAG: DNA repair and recombination protein RadB [Candidatus Methanogranum gryphiswaldense]|nr:MAG: DNA repair and recombination protein RadB [Candidatus Methanogranum sp. U3.2.1]